MGMCGCSQLGIAQKPKLPAEIKAIVDDAPFSSLVANGLSLSIGCEIPFGVAQSYLSSLAVVNLLPNPQQSLKQLNDDFLKPARSSEKQDPEAQKSASVHREACESELRWRSGAALLNMARMLLFAKMDRPAQPILDDLRRKTASNDFILKREVAELLWRPGRRQDAIDAVGRIEKEDDRAAACEALALDSLERQDSDGVQLVLGKVGDNSHKRRIEAKSAAKRRDWPALTDLLDRINGEERQDVASLVLRDVSDGSPAVAERLAGIIAGSKMDDGGRLDVIRYYIKENKLDQAETAVPRLYLEGSRARAWTLIAVGYARRGQPAKATSLLQKAGKEADSESLGWGYASMVGILGGAQMEPEFGRYLAMAREKAGKDPSRYMDLAYALVLANRSSEAAALLEPIKTSDKNAFGCRERGEASYLYARIGRFKEAKQASACLTSGTSSLSSL